jgi:protein TonB
MTMALVRAEPARPYAASHSGARRLTLGAGVALALHALACVGLGSLPLQLARPPLALTEIDLLPPAPAPVPVPAPAAVPAPRARQAARALERRPARDVPPAAAAAPLHTADERAPSAGEPVRFAVDARGASYGFGTVAQGGTAAAAAPGAAVVPVRTPPAPDLRSFAAPPRLDESDPCRGHFPGAASADRGDVTLELRVSAQGAVRAALACLRAKRFQPARDAAGRAVPALAPVAVHFAR